MVAQGKTPIVGDLSPVTLGGLVSDLVYEVGVEANFAIIGHDEVVGNVPNLAFVPCQPRLPAKLITCHTRSGDSRFGPKSLGKQRCWRGKC